MSIEVMVFGQLTDITGSSSIRIEDIEDTNALQENLIQLFPGLAGIKFTVAVDRKTISGNTPIHAGSSIALMPPFSGG